MQINFWGVRGSIASPGAETAGIGGNTSCVEVRCGQERIIFDAGTGLRRLGNAMMSEGSKALDATILLSHFHWDHIQGIPFFVPAYLPSTKLTIAGAANGVMSIRETLAHQMTAPVFPVRLDELAAELTLRDVRAGEPFAIGDARVRCVKTNHPGGAHAYRIDWRGRSVVYATDTEHYACVDPALVELAGDADVLIYDSQYTPEEYRGSKSMRSKVGWGHSTYVAGAELAHAAGVGKYVLFHHDPQRSDDGVVAIESSARELFASSVAAREGMRIDLEPNVKAISIAPLSLGAA